MKITKKETLVMQAALALTQVWAAGLTSDKETKLIWDVAQVIHHSLNKEDKATRIRKILPNLLQSLSEDEKNRENQCNFILHNVGNSHPIQ